MKKQSMRKGVTKREVRKEQFKRNGRSKMKKDEERKTSRVERRKDKEGNDESKRKEDGGKR